MQLKPDNFPGGETMRFFFQLFRIIYCLVQIICKHRLRTTTSTHSKQKIFKKNKKILHEN